MSDTETLSTPRRSGRLAAAEFSLWPEEKILACLTEHGVPVEPGLDHAQLVNLLLAATALPARPQTPGETQSTPLGGKSRSKRKNVEPASQGLAVNGVAGPGVSHAALPPSEETPPSPRSGSTALLMSAMTTLAAAVGSLEARLLHQAPPPPSEPPALAPLSGFSLPVAAAAPPPPSAPGPSLSSARPVSPSGNFFVSPFSNISPRIKSQILEGRDVNLASLLLPSPECDRRLIGSDQFSAVFRAADPRTTRTLSFCDFVIAFGLFRDTLCEAFPARMPELNAYLALISELYRRYGGSLFYEYHKAFSAKAANYLARFSTRLDWSCVDTELLVMFAGGHRALTCRLCNQVDHSAEVCPRSVLPGGGESVSESEPRPLLPCPPAAEGPCLDSHGREVVVFNDTPICNNFNENVCTFTSCRFSHVCSFCKGPHSKAVCPGRFRPPRGGGGGGPRPKVPRLSKPF